MSIIEIQGLTKNFGMTRALNGVNLSVSQGEVYGFIGPNGAGKSTTIRVLLGMLKKDAGNIALFGKDPWKNAVELHRRLVYIPGDVVLWPNLTGGEVIDFLGRLQGGVDPVRRKVLLERFQLDPKRKCKDYSKGNRQKVALVAAFASDVELLVLDEPTSGLDPLMEQIFQQCVAEAKGVGKTVFLSSHILAEVEAVCDRVGIIRGGVMVESGTLSELRHLTRTTVTVELANRPDWQSLSGIHNLRDEGGRWHFSVDAQAMDDTMKALAPLGIRAMTAEPPTLEELFLRHYGENITGQEVG